MYINKTVLNDNIIGWEDFEDNQLLRCKKHKIYEKKILLNMPKNSSFLDIGAHYGDTCITMAIHAKNNNRKDIRFFAFEPNKTKCEHIKKIAKLNDINIKIYNNCVGNSNFKTSPDTNELFGHVTYSHDSNGKINIIKLNDIENEIIPVGFMHIDTEGWEKYVLLGASNILNNKINKMYVIVEYWGIGGTKVIKDKNFCKGVLNDNPRKELLLLTKKFNCKVIDILRCIEKNLVFTVNYNT